MMDPLQSGAIFRITNAAALRSPVPLHARRGGSYSSGSSAGPAAWSANHEPSPSRHSPQAAAIPPR